jgi:hypothetical protein
MTVRPGVGLVERSGREEEKKAVQARESIARSSVIRLCFVGLLFACGGGEENGGKTDGEAVGTAVDCGNPMAWDSDGDGVSDRIEASNADQFLSGRCDENPSEPQGEYAAGSLQGGVNLPDQGPGYAHIHADMSDPGEGDWATLELLACVETVGRDLEGLTKIHLGDLSRKSGGEFEPHVTHQNGLEIEVRYPRKDGRDELFDIRQQPEVYDPLLTRNLFSAFVRLCRVDAIFADASMLSFPVGEGDLANVINHPDRRTHFLVRLERPTG